MLKEENLITLSGDFLPGQRLAKIGDTFVPVGIGADKAPGTTVVKDIGKGVYYKCASVSNTTWSGNKAFQNEDGTWGFEDAVTSGLSFTEIKPEKGKVYSFDALVEVKLWDGNILPQEGLIFYTPLAKATDTAETGQSLTISGNVSYAMLDDIPCAYFDGSASSYISFSDSGLPAGAENRSISVFVTRTESLSDSVIYNYGTDSSYTRFGLFLHDTKAVVGIGSINCEFKYLFVKDVTYHIMLTLSDKVVNLWIDGVLIGSHTFSTLNTTLNGIGYIGYRNGNPFTGYLSSFRIYNRVLTDDEILQLSQEFTPTA